MAPKKYSCIPYSPEWERIANIKAREYVDLVTCVHCGTPTVSGYCCTTCNSSDPAGNEAEQLAYYNWCEEERKRIKH